MSPSEKENDAKKAGVEPEPLCLFCFPEDTLFAGRKTYVNAIHEIRKEENSRGLVRRGKEEFWLKKRTEARIRRRRRMKEPIRNLRSYLLASVKNEKLGPKAGVPSLFEVLETVKDAWPSPSSGNFNFRDEEQTQQQTQNLSKMKDENHDLQFPCQLLNRRMSMPEELMRKYSVKERTSEESETNKTAVEISPSSSSAMETARRKDTGRMETTRKDESQRTQSTKTDACQQTSDAEEGKTKKTDPSNLPKRVMQDDYYKQGKRIIKVKEKSRCTCREDQQSSTTASAKEETDDSGTTESIQSSSPTQLPKRESSSSCPSSESDNIRCTCAELSSKETSTDFYLSGKSTLSQTVSDKSVSTQDSTVSINSVSTRGSTVSDNSNSTTPEIERTSAKETTTSTDYSPRTPRNRKNRRRDKKVYHDHSKSCPKHSRNHPAVGYVCPVHSGNATEDMKTTANASTNTDNQENSTTQTAEIPQKEETEEQETEKNPTAKPQEERYKWAKLTREELYMMQQLQHRKFVESQRKLSNPLPPTPETRSMTACGTGSAYAETERLDQPILIPRYSALPRSLSMLVNTSSPDTSHNSDSDSLADSLEEQPITHVHKLYFDTKKESKPVRGDVNVVEETKQKKRQPRGRAFFVSIKEPFGEDELIESIQKIPQPPEKIKNQIFERHLNLCTKHKRLHKTSDEHKPGEKKKKPTEDEKTSKTRKNPSEETKKSERKSLPKKQEPEMTVKKKKETKGKTCSKIPVLVSGRSGSSSPERESEAKEKPARPKIRVRKEKEQQETKMETTQILEITHAGSELSLQKPQAVIHPSQAPLDPKPDLTIPPLVSSLRIPPLRQTWNKQILLANARRSPVGKFRQRFEVIPEEKSSSLSSAEDKNVLPKFADASTSPVPSDKLQFNSFNVNDVSNLIVAKITNKQLETLPYVQNKDNQKIILLSSKSQNSTKGRDALIAMNREDFSRLAKGWMNFYKLNENMENEENEDKKPKPEGEKPMGKPKTETQHQKNSGRKQGEPELGDTVRFDCSNTILRTSRSTEVTDTSRSAKKQNSLPELKLPGRTCEIHKSTAAGSLPRLEDDSTDSDSTDYMEPPSPRVPPLSIDDIPSDATLSSSDGELPQPEPPSFKYSEFKKRPSVGKPRLKKENPFGTSRFGGKKNSGWSVTVAGTVELSRSAPDLEMRLSFPSNGGPPVVSHSDSGFAEDSNYSKIGGSLQDLESCTTAQEVPLGSGNLKQKWMVTVKNPKKGGEKDAKGMPNSNGQRLPDLEPPPSRHSKKVLKGVQLDEKVKRLVERKMRAIWPKLQKVIKKEFLTESGRLITEPDEIEGGSLLSVRGSAVQLEQKEKPQTMTERDITRRYTSRTN